MRNSIKQLTSLMRTSRQNYEQYLSNGKSFRHAKALRQSNQQIIDLLEQTDFAVGTELAAALQELADHLRDWAACWDREQVARRPDNDDPFVFTGYKTYPKNLDALLAAQGRSTEHEG